jgi:hypothetical protein
MYEINRLFDFYQSDNRDIFKLMILAVNSQPL